MGDGAALGVLLDIYRNYLRFMARSLLDEALKTRIEASDLVQETYLKAYKQFEQFSGATERELIAWMRQILVHNIRDQAKHHRRHGRDMRLQESLEAMLDRSSTAVHEALATSTCSPVEQAAKREQAVLLANALERLPADHQAVFELRNIKHVSFDEIARRMGRSPNAVRKLWARTLEMLRSALEES